ASSIFSGDFDMWLSFDEPQVTNWTLDSTHVNAAFVTSSSYLTDGKIAIPSRFTWDRGTQSTAVVTVFHGSIPAGFDVPGNGPFVVAIFCPKTPYAIPAGVPVSVTIVSAGG